MSDINNSKKNVADNPFRPAAQTVGLNYGDRAKFIRNDQPSSQPQARQSLDQFEKSRDADKSAFAPNTAYRTQRRQTVEGYKPKMLDHVENGTAPRTGKTSAPSDDTILNFLDKVISLPPAAKKAVATAAKKPVFIKA